MIRNSLRLILPGLLGLALGCAGQPAWVLQPQLHTHGTRYVVAVGTASLGQGAARARIVAEQSARTALAARVNTQIHASIVDSMREQLDHSSGTVQSVETMRQNLATTVNQSLEGVEILEVYEDADREVVYALAALDLQALRARVQDWSSEVELQLGTERRRLREAVTRADLRAVQLAVQALRSVDAAPPGYAMTLQAFDRTLVPPDASVATDIDAAMVELRGQWPTQSPPVLSGGVVRMQLPRWQDVRWHYQLRPAGGPAQDLYVHEAVGEIRLPSDTYTDASGRVTIQLWPDVLGQTLGHAFVVELPAVRRPEIRPEIQDTSCGESARMAVQVALEQCLAQAGWQVTAGALGLQPTYTLSCGATQRHDFGTGVVLSSAASLRGGTEASGRAPVLDYSATVVGHSEDQLRSSAAERLARAVCAGLDPGQ